MEGERKKRKLENEKEEEEEEETMEEFFALIRSTKQVRDRIRCGSNELKEKEEKEGGIWKPSFQPEDFMEDDKLSKSTDQAEPSNRKQKAAVAEKEVDKEDKEKEGNGLDLNLSL
ncbi:protein NIM1-INTERACTING 1-like [Quillaja saponaria]|uniref:Protein NIM1-INTERACTING 1-like n=1 Tax=Quillaja saponaria TaxID=32244 RepID=A0AAD7VJH2_QUISA|nr:protein NIM1-INTERACTING 1-like [Quillaja saponaria]